MSRHNLIFNDFYCLNCGFRLTLPRKRGHQTERAHLKKCYCPGCKHTINFYEVKDSEDLEYFREAFANGEFVEYAQNDIAVGYKPTGLEMS